MTRVVITGTGWVTPLGSDVDSVWTKLLAGASGIGRISRFNASTFETDFAAEVPLAENGAPGGFDLANFMDTRAARYSKAGLSSRFALAAGAQAWVQAGLGDKTGKLTAQGVDPDRCGVYLGAGEGPMDYDAYFACALPAWTGTEIDAVQWAERARELFNSRIEIEQEPHVTITHVADAFGLGGPAYNCLTACAASTQAVGEAYEIIKRGDADIMMAGGTHSMIHLLGMTGFSRLTAMSTRRDTPQAASRPFNKSRDGFVMGEGAGIVVIESLESALRRGATPLAEIAGFGSSADAYRITDIQPEGLGAVKAMRAALEEAGIDPTKADAQGRGPVQYLSAHGTGTPENDGIETKAVKATFGDMAPNVPFSSVKSMLGHLIQAAGGVELITCVKAIETGFIPPTINLDEPDPECDLDHVPNEPRDTTGAGGIDVCLSNSFGFGGQNDSICIKRFAE